MTARAERAAGWESPAGEARFVKEGDAVSAVAWRLEYPFVAKPNGLGRPFVPARAAERVAGCEEPQGSAAVEVVAPVGGPSVGDRSIGPAEPPIALERGARLLGWLGRSLTVLVAAVAAAAVTIEAPTAGEGAGSAAATAAGAGPRVVVVEAGETVWDLAVAHTPEGERPAAYVAEVVAANGVTATSIEPGTELRLPRAGGAGPGR
jgi:hypothetical protein